MKRREFKVIDEDGKVWLIEAWTPRGACTGAAEARWHECAGELGDDTQDMWCEGQFFEVHVEFRPVFHGVDRTPDPEPPKLREHNCDDHQFGYPGIEFCEVCTTHKGKANRHKDRVRRFEELKRLAEEARDE